MNKSTKTLPGILMMSGSQSQAQISGYVTVDENYTLTLEFHKAEF